MAKITTGDIELLKILYDQVDEKFSPVGSFRELLNKALNTPSTSVNNNSIQATINLQDSGKVILDGDFTAASKDNFSIKKLTYLSATGPTLEAIGSVQMSKDGTFISANFSKIIITDGNAVLDKTQSQLTGEFTGQITVSVNNKVITSHVLLKNMTKSFSNGFTLFQQATSGLKDYDSQAPKESYAEIIKSTSKEVVFKLEQMKDSQNIKLRNVDEFIAFHLSGNDSITGTANNDYLYAGAGNDTVNSGTGNDLIVGGDGAGDDTYEGGKGIDTVKYTSAKAGITVDLSKGTATSTTGKDSAGIGSDKLKNIEYVVAGDYADTLIGSKDANSIVGGLGNDTIDCGLGNDTLVGGDGADVFVFSTKPATNNIDTIIDFQAGIDKIQLSRKLFPKLIGKTDFLALESSSDSATHFLIYDSNTGKLSYDADGNATKIKPVDIALIGKGLPLSTTDFITS